MAVLISSSIPHQETTPARLREMNFPLIPSEEGIKRSCQASGCNAASTHCSPGPRQKDKVTQR